MSNPNIERSRSPIRSRSPVSSSPSTSHGDSGSRSRSQNRSNLLYDSQQTPRPSDRSESHTPLSATSESGTSEFSRDAGDRVFPIRSVVSVDPNVTPSARSENQSGDGFPGMGSANVRFERRNTSQLDHSSSNAPSDSAPGESSFAPQDDTPSKNETRTERRLSASAESGTRPGMRKRLSSKDMGGPFSMSTRIQHSIGEEQSESMITRTTQSRGFHSAVESMSTRSHGDGPGPLVTTRFQHVVTEEGHAVITGRGGDTLQRCEDEPIHMPGAIQGFGLLIVLQEMDDGKMQVRIVSENSKRFIGYTPTQLFRLDSFCDILTEEQSDNLLDHVDFIRDEDVDPVTNGPEVFTLAIRQAVGKASKFWCAMHLCPTNPDLIICEFELEDDPVYPLVPRGEQTPEPPEDTLSSNPTRDELSESTVNISRPLRVLRSARKRKGEAAAMEVFNIMSQVQEQLSHASSLEMFLKILVGVVKELTGFHRVMIYQFDSSWNGRVVTELVDPRATKDLYKGLNFPASDIPKQARDLYKINKVRLLYDREQETARLVCRTIEDLENPLDLTHAYLRAMSPIHVKYLRNMAVRSSMSISINAFNELWGLVSCHTYGSKGMRVSFPIRKMCRLVGDSASQNIERLSYASRLQARKLINTVPTQSNPSGYIIASSDDLLNLFDADCGLLSIRDETKVLGKLEQTQEALAMLEYLRLRKFPSVTHSTDIKFDFSDLRYPPGFTFIAGLLLVPLSSGGNDFIVFFRKGVIREVKWAGNPYEKFIKEGTEGYLEPRESFRTWSETIVGKCKDWTEEQIETAAVLCLVYGKFIDVWRQKEAALQNSQLTKLLLANSAHEVRTPLNAIINYLEIAMEGSIDSETRDNLTRSYSASKSLIYVINDLLDLTKTEEGAKVIKDEIFDLPATVREATDSFTNDAKRKGLGYQNIEDERVPQFVVGDQRRVRQAISNVVANAISYTTTGNIKIETCLVKQSEGHVDIDVVVLDTGCGMSSAKLDALFRELEQVQSEDDEGLEKNFAMEPKHIEASEGPKRNLGLGLAIVARILRNMDGQLRLKSEEGKGSRFVMQFNFDLPTETEDRSKTLETAHAGVSPLADQPTTPEVELGEVMLVNKSAQKTPLERPREIVRCNSADSTRSLASMKSFKSGESAKSDVDRMIEAITEPSHSESTRPSSRRSLRRETSPQAMRRRSIEHSPVRAGSLGIKDSKTPIRPVRLPGDVSTGSPSTEHPPILKPHTPARVTFDFRDGSDNTKDQLTADRLQVLVAEDDPINSKIIKKRLEKLGHEVHLTVNGEECSSTFGDRPASFDVVLMDMQMPIVDGLTSTKIIRSFEKSHFGNILSARGSLNGRTPIIAVSASLVERERQIYIDAGFDAWILKPVDFKRLTVLLNGIVEEQTRQACLYETGEWERGGWFQQNTPDVFSAKTAPSPTTTATDAEGMKSYPVQPEESATDQERQRLSELDDDAVRADSVPVNPGTSGDIHQSMEGQGKKAEKGKRSSIS